MTPIATTLVENMDVLLGYTRKKIGDPELAADVVQQSLLKALEAAPTLHDDAKVLPWIYRILNNTITDLYRRRGVERKYEPALVHEVESTIPPEDHAILCRCLDTLLPTLNPDDAALIKLLELGDEDPQIVADRLGVTRGALKVRRHRARQRLKTRLEETCRTCATHGCLDCSCQRS